MTGREVNLFNLRAKRLLASGVLNVIEIVGLSAELDAAYLAPPTPLI